MRVLDLLTAALPAFGLFGNPPPGPVFARPSKPILDDELITFIDKVRLRWDIQGVGIGIVASPNFTHGLGLSEDDGWRSEVHTFGKAALGGNDLTPDVGGLPQP